MSKALANNTAIVKRKPKKELTPDEMFKAVALDIGKEVAAYIAVMYPEAVKATSSTFLLSVRNCTYNQILGVREADRLGEDFEERLERREKWRREWKAAWKKIREGK